MILTHFAFILSTGIALAAPIDTTQSNLKWTGQKPTSEHWGSLQFSSGNIEIRQDKWVGGEFNVDMTSMTVDDIKGPKGAKLLRHLKNDDFFGVDQFDTATLRITSTKGEQIEGDLTIKGKTHPISFNYKKEKEAYTGKMIFDRTLYGITYKSKSIIEGLGDKFIKDQVIVDFKIVLKDQ